MRLPRQGLLVADADRSHLTLEPRADGAMETLQGHSVTDRIALGPNAGCKVFTLQTVPVTSAAEDRSGAAKAAGFSLHAGVAAAAMSARSGRAGVALSLARRCPPRACR